MKFSLPFGGSVQLPDPAPVAFTSYQTKTAHGIVFREGQEAVCACGHVMEWDWETSTMDGDCHPTLATAFGAHLREVQTSPPPRG